MDLTTARRLIEEVAPRVADTRVSSVKSPGSDCLLLELAGKRPLYLGAVTTKALPILFVLDDRGAIPTERAELPPFAAQLKGATLARLEPMATGTGAVAHLHWTSQVGRTVERRLVIDLGRNPSLTLVDGAATDGPGGTSTADASDTAANAPAGASPTVTSWHDEHGRLHARLSSVARDDAAGTTREFDSLNDGAIYMFAELWPAMNLSRRREALERVIERRIKRTRRAMDKVQAEIDDSGNADTYRQMGQLLMTKQNEVGRGKSSVTLVDFDGETEVTIELDPKTGPQQNAESYFRRARKAERRLERAPVRLGELEEKAADYQRAADSLDGATDEELKRLEQRFLKKRPTTSDRKAPKERARFRTYHISGGWEVLVGKTNQDNDVLTHQIAKPSDLWFHARQVAGSHVVLKRSGKKAEPDKQAILEAAAIAAFHSKAGKSSKVSVCYTEKRHVRKARGGKPGLAVVAREKVVMVRPKLPES